MNETTKFRIPENTEFIEQTMKNGMLVTKFIPKVEELKDGDCYKITHSPDKNGFLIMKDKYNAYVNLWTDGTIEVNDSGCFEVHKYDPAITKITRQEMQSELAKHGKVFDFDNKVLKDLKWRAKKAEKFYFIDACIQVDSTNDYYNDLSDRMFSIGNYFRTKQECQDFCDKVKQLLK